MSLKRVRRSRRQVPHRLTPQQVAKALGGDFNGKWINIRGPNHGPSDRSLGLRLNPNAPDGFFINSLASDALAECRGYAKARLREITTASSIFIEGDAVGGASGGNAHIVGSALAIWNQATLAQGTFLELYLVDRGCHLSDAVIKAGALRFHPSCPFGKYRFPAMIALMCDVITGEPTGIHRTALRDNGSSKRIMPDGMSAKMMLGPSKVAAIKLSLRAERMGIAEGIETALSASQIFGMPVWAVLSAGGMADFPIIPGVKHLTIFADHDEPGLRAATKCARKHARARVDVSVRYPTKFGTDWNDVIKDLG